MRTALFTVGRMSVLVAIIFTTASRNAVGATVHANSALPSGPVRHNVRDTSPRLPMIFEQNSGQSDSVVRFLSHGAGYTVFLTAKEAVVSLPVHIPGGHTANGPTLRMRL